MSVSLSIPTSISKNATRIGCAFPQEPTCRKLCRHEVLLRSVLSRSVNLQDAYTSHIQPIAFFHVCNRKTGNVGLFPYRASKQLMHRWRPIGHTPRTLCGQGSSQTEKSLARCLQQRCHPVYSPSHSSRRTESFGFDSLCFMSEYHQTTCSSFYERCGTADEYQRTLLRGPRHLA